ncbi:hypothetical protein AB9F45_39600, partial [Rhizobium leguminosarum]|uniref:hypothetical protein n=1 Tax=Rhizobium leguminosarum TaxID=384 RepID=UPI003F9E4EC4
SGSLIEAVDSLNDGPRGLREFTVELPGIISPISVTTLLVIREVIFRRTSRGANEEADERAEAQSV